MMNAKTRLAVGTDRICIPTEYREGERTVHATVIQEGRVASVRREVFAPRSLQWDHSGIDILAGHEGESLAVAFPQRTRDLEIRVAIPATKKVLDARKQFGSHLSIEFLALEDRQNASGVREINRALLTAAAFVATPEYTQGVSEVRSRKVRKWL